MQKNACSLKCNSLVYFSLTAKTCCFFGKTCQILIDWSKTFLINTAGHSNTRLTSKGTPYNKNELFTILKIILLYSVKSNKQAKVAYMHINTIYMHAHQITNLKNMFANHQTSSLFFSLLKRLYCHSIYWLFKKFLAASFLVAS